MTTPELAVLLGKSPETVGSWEVRRRAIDKASWLVLATLALEHFDAPVPLRSRIEALATPMIGEHALALDAPAEDDQPPPASSERGRVLHVPFRS